MNDQWLPGEEEVLGGERHYKRSQESFGGVNYVHYPDCDDDFITMHVCMYVNTHAYLYSHICRYIYTFVNIYVHIYEHTVCIQMCV